MVRSEKTRQTIIEKTAAIFNKKGYTGTYMSDLTAATGLTKGSIYGNFKDKNEVALEAFRYNYQFQTRQLMGKLDQLDLASDKLLAFLDHYRKAYRPIFENGGCAILNTAVDADDGNEWLKKEVIQKIQDWSARLISIVTKGISRGELMDIDPEEYAYRTIALIEGSILLAKTLNKPDILMKNMDHLSAEIKEMTQK
ncbi:TetR/AcrR family transcriptional regulator [Reichenbachiella ulvae]|uniref:TetR/AcrR family transcriptional regulator n=1 Tax=Reichenbachiella ulvae TaxID=2980104 RepID=A0ABT3CPK7_9BACT|nr:TetR/AcrR family transcriptional regulator [Reichenbachiella ulvae]MCV9385459.1 TetR/AcrR family transcriptional regulator [Reichenbachiella ulvae]